MCSISSACRYPPCRSRAASSCVSSRGSSQQSQHPTGGRSQRGAGAEHRGLEPAGVLSDDHAAHRGTRIDLGGITLGANPPAGISAACSLTALAHTHRHPAGRARRLSLLPLCGSHPAQARTHRNRRRGAAHRLHPALHRRADRWNGVHALIASALPRRGYPELYGPAARHGRAMRPRAARRDSRRSPARSPRACS